MEADNQGSNPDSAECDVNKFHYSSCLYFLADQVRMIMA